MLLRQLTSAFDHGEQGCYGEQLNSSGKSPTDVKVLARRQFQSLRQTHFGSSESLFSICEALNPLGKRTHIVPLAHPAVQPKCAANLPRTTLESLRTA